MAPQPQPQIANMDTSLAIPRQNGELVFAAPWEARAFGMAVVLCDQGLYAWRQFSQGLTTEIATAEAQGMDSGYYERWLASLEKLVTAAGLVSPDELETRAAEYASGLRTDHDEEPHHHSHAHEAG